jgi:hypothetical protein
LAPAVEPGVEVRIVFLHSEAAYEEVRRTQQELRERAARAQLLARARRDAAEASRSPARRRGWFARRFRANLARP